MIVGTIRADARCACGWRSHGERDAVMQGFNQHVLAGCPEQGEVFTMRVWRRVEGGLGAAPQPPLMPPPPGRAV